MIKVLYTDDEPSLLEIGKLYLEESGEMQVEIAVSAKDAIRMLKERTFDVIVSDYQMPGMDGIEFLKYLRVKCHSLPFILFTGRGREEIVIAAINNGADFYLQKGGDPSAQFAELGHKIKLAVQRYRSDQTIVHFNRLYSVLSGVNTTIVRATSGNELFSEICRISVEDGRFTMAWIGLVDTSKSMLVPAAHYGFEDGYLKGIILSVDDNPRLQGPAVRAVREKSHVIFNTIPSELLSEPGPGEIKKRGYHSTGAFPLFIHNTIVGALQLYSAEENFFSENEIHLLDEVASDISFALERMEAEKNRVRTEISLKENEEKLAAIVAGSPVPKFVIDSDHTIIYWNRAIEQATGISAAQMIGTHDQWRAFYNEVRPTMADLILDGETDRILELYAGKCSESPVVAGAFEATDFFPHMGEKGTYLRFMAAPIKNNLGVTLGAVETLIDVSDIKHAEVELVTKNEELQAACEEITATEEGQRQQVELFASAQQALCESETRYRNIVEDQTEFICRFLPDGTHVFVNDAYCRYFGVARKDILGHRFRPDLYADDREAVRRFFATLTPEMPVGTMDQRIIMPDGTTRWQRWSDRAIFDECGKVGEYQSVGRDITEFKLVEERLQKTFMEYQDLLENISDVYYRSDTAGRLVLASRSWAVLLGYPDLTECIGRNIAATFYADPHERSLFLEAVYQNGYVTDFEVSLKKKDGSLVTVATSSYLYFDDAGHVLGVEGTFRDITERKRITEDLKETKQRLADIINFLPDATFAIDNAGTVIAWNHAIEEMTGVKSGDISGKGDYIYALPFYGEQRPTLIDLISSDAPEQMKNYSSVRKEGDVLTAESGMVHVGGKDLILWGKASPLYNSRGEVTGAIESIRDITEQKILEEALQQVNKKLNLLSSVTRHDILTKITICLEYLKTAKQKSHPPGMQKLIDILELNIGAIQTRIDFMSIYEDLGVTAPAWLEIGVLLQRCPAEPKIPVIPDVSHVEVYADPLVGKVFYNLHDNTRRHGEHATEIHVTAQERGKDLVIVWEDDGIGVPREEKEKIFERGYGKNTGLGLFLVREILGITGISISETGVYGSGVRFEIVVPKGRYRCTDPPLPCTSPPNPQVPAGSTTGTDEDTTGELP